VPGSCRVEHEEIWDSEESERMDRTNDQRFEIKTRQTNNSAEKPKRTERQHGGRVGVLRCGMWYASVMMLAMV